MRQYTRWLAQHRIAFEASRFWIPDFCHYATSDLALSARDVGFPGNSAAFVVAAAGRLHITPNGGGLFQALAAARCMSGPEFSKGISQAIESSLGVADDFRCFVELCDAAHECGLKVAADHLARDILSVAPCLGHIWTHPEMDICVLDAA